MRVQIAFLMHGNINTAGAYLIGARAVRCAESSLDLCASADCVSRSSLWSWQKEFSILFGSW